MKYFDCLSTNPYIYLLENDTKKTRIGGVFSFVGFTTLFAFFVIYFPHDLLCRNRKSQTYHKTLLDNESSFQIPSPIFLTFSDNQILNDPALQIFAENVPLSASNFTVEKHCENLLDLEHFFNNSERVCLRIAFAQGSMVKKLDLKFPSGTSIEFNIIFRRNLLPLYSDERTWNCETEFFAYLGKIRPSQSKSLQLFFKKSEFYVQRSFPFSSSESYSDFFFESSQEIVNQENNTDPLLGVEFESLSKKLLTFRNEELSWICLASSFGGFVFFVTKTLGFFAFPVLKFWHLLQIASEIIDFKIVTISDKKGSLDEAKIDFRQIKPPKTEELKSKDKDLDKFFLNVKVVKSELVSQKDIVLEKSNNTPQQEKTIRIMKFRWGAMFLTRFILQKLFWGNSKEFFVVETAIEKIRSLMDIKARLKTADEVNVLKRFIFDKNQAILFNKFHDVVVKIPDQSASSIINSKFFCAKKMGLRSFNRRLLGAYTMLTQSLSPCRQKDTKILDFIDTETRKFMDKLIRE